MKTLVTTCNLDLFKMFYECKYHETFKKDLVVYVDLEDPNEFKKLVDSRTQILSKEDFRKHYGKLYMDGLRTFKKIYLINMLLEKGELDEGFYFTDDDIVSYAEMTDFFNETNSFYDCEVSNMSNLYRESWPIMHEFMQYGKKLPQQSASGFYIAKADIPKTKELFKDLFYKYINILKSEEDRINAGNLKSNSKRKVSTEVFYLDTFFLNILFSNIYNENTLNCNFAKPSYMWVRRMRDKLKVNDTSTIMKALTRPKKSTKYKTQPYFHPIVVNKAPLMREYFNAIHELDPVYSNAVDLLMLNPKERSKILKSQHKSLI